MGGATHARKVQSKGAATYQHTGKYEYYVELSFTLSEAGPTKNSPATKLHT